MIRISALEIKSNFFKRALIREGRLKEAGAYKNYIILYRMFPIDYKE